MRLFPKNSLLLVMDYSIGEIPDSIGHGPVSSTGSCVAVGTLAEMDGETDVTLTDTADAVVPKNLVFDGTLETPAKEISVCSVDDEKLLTIPVGSEKIRVKIFTNDESEPDQIAVLVVV